MPDHATHGQVDRPGRCVASEVEVPDVGLLEAWGAHNLDNVVAALCRELVVAGQ